jgi:site-specific DNA-methyltransferase (adenine-specific)
LHRLNGYQDDVFQCDIPRGKKRVHPTQKPIEIVKYLIENSAKENTLILDPFMGSGTTVVAAKELGKDFIGIEISPIYCKIAEDRLRQEYLFAA